MVRMEKQRQNSREQFKRKTKNTKRKSLSSKKQLTKKETLEKSKSFLKRMQQDSIARKKVLRANHFSNNIRERKELSNKLKECTFQPNLEKTQLNKKTKAQLESIISNRIDFLTNKKPHFSRRRLKSSKSTSSDILKYKT